jgi:aryl-alcohol dehydrogenase-like predicted oxidoreductase
LINKYGYSRNQLIVGSKLGFIPEDAENGHRCHYFVSKLVEQNKITIDDIIYDEKNRPIHCIHPEFLNSQLQLSLDNLKLETLDILYLHNVFETQGPVIHKDLLEKRLAAAFEFLVIQILTKEKSRADGKIMNYGLASWQSFRVNNNNPGVHSNLQNIYQLAEKVGGKDHGFRFVQTPINLMNPEAFTEKYQTFVKDDKAAVGPLTAICCELKVNLISSSPLLQGYLINTPLENQVFNVKHNASKHIQFIRSIPAESLKCS